MSKNVRIRMEVYKRILLAKALHTAAEAACATKNDEFAFMKGILLLHDAAESALGAIADQLNAHVKGNHYLMQYPSLIEKADHQQRQVPYKLQLRNLNTLRNNAKHDGILSDPKANAHFPQIVRSLLEELCNTYLSLDFSSVSLKYLIRDDKIRQYIDEAQKQVDEARFEQALTCLAYAMYFICESSTMPTLFSHLWANQEETGSIFAQPFEINHTIKLVGHGVDTFLYYRFTNLTPMIGYRKDTKELFAKWNKEYGHPANWSDRNARFCLNFCIDTALKFQREPDEGYTLVYYSDVFEDVIEPVGDKATVWNLSEYNSPVALGKPSQTRQVRLILRKGQKIIGVAYDNQEAPDEWMLLIKNPTDEVGKLQFGYVAKREVSTTRRKIQSPEQGANLDLANSD
ncbi:MAG: hypothetical protein KAT11_03630 [Phycisphaerae bacterium]|nr:hypothetical protein [Phycisphaerae bacterium]